MVFPHQEKNDLTSESQTFFFYDSSKNQYAFFLDGHLQYSSTLPLHKPYITIPTYVQMSLPSAFIDKVDFFVQEGLRSRWFSLPNVNEGNYVFACGDYHFSTLFSQNDTLSFHPSTGKYTLMRWYYNHLKYPILCEQIDYFSFVTMVEKVPEFQKERYIEELSMVDAMQGAFFSLQDKAIACFQMVGRDFVYVSYFGVFPEYRKSNVSYQLLQSLWMYANQMKKDLVVAVTEPSLVEWYLKKGFQIVGYWQEK